MPFDPINPTVHNFAWVFPIPESREAIKESFVIVNKDKLYFEIHKDIKRVKKEGNAQGSESVVVHCRFENLAKDEHLLIKVETSESGKENLFSTGFLKPSTPFVPCSANFMMPSKSASGKLQVELVNFTFVVEGTNFRVHKAVCAVRCPGLRKTYFISFSTNNTAVIKDISKGDFKEFLSFIWASLQEFTNVRNMLAIARKFDFKVLVNICAGQLRAELSDDTAEEVFFVAHEFDCDDGLKEDSFKLIQARFAKINCKMPDSLVGEPEAVKDAIEKKKAIDESENVIAEKKRDVEKSVKAHEMSIKDLEASLNRMLKTPK